ncbi:MAG TPA: glycosyltransferase family 2 protein [Streptosporangiaceae bacterium]|nr:glycosyltransferase family 2 protein [Streptosporangiaceae bacterium]
MGRVKYSIVVPVYNEEESFAALSARLREVMDQLDGPAEAVLVDDGSTDGSYRLMVEARDQDDRFKIVQLSRNFGHQLAITAGMDLASGQAVIVMDADLQDPPHVILDLAAKWQEGYEVVYAVRQHRDGETQFKKLSASMFYSLLHRLADIDQTMDVGDFRLVDRRALDAFLSMRERNRYVRGMFSWVGFRQAGVPYNRDSRHAGKSKYSLRKMVRLALNGIIGFSTVPLKLAMSIGFFLAFASVLYGLVAIALKLAGVQIVPGYTSLLVAITFLSGIQLTVMGMVGQYVARVYDEARGRPLYLIRETRGFAGPAAADISDHAGGVSIARQAGPPAQAGYPARTS